MMSIRNGIGIEGRILIPSILILITGRSAKNAWDVLRCFNTNAKHHDGFSMFDTNNLDS